MSALSENAGILSLTRHRGLWVLTIKDPPVRGQARTSSRDTAVGIAEAYADWRGRNPEPAKAGAR
jgi:hypothetical protein